MPFDPRSLDGTTWLCEPGYVRRAVQRLAAIPTCPTARELVEARHRRLEAAKQASSGALRATKGRIGVIPIYGPVEQRVTAELEKLGGTSLEEVGTALDMLVADASVSAIVLHIDSPGGSSYGTQELSDKIYAARGAKKIYAIADSLAASASYWIATAAEQLMVTPGGDVGSVGVYAVHIDESKALEEEGLQVTMISAGKYKTEFASFAPLGDDARAALQEQVDYTYTKFLAGLKRNRGLSMEEVRKNFGQGRVVNAEQAVAAKMADRVMPLDELLGRLTGGMAADNGKRATAEILRLRHEHAKRRAG